MVARTKSQRSKQDPLQTPGSIPLDPAPRLRRPDPAARPFRHRMIKSYRTRLRTPAALSCFGETMRNATLMHDAARFCRRVVDPGPMDRSCATEM